MTAGKPGRDFRARCAVMSDAELAALDRSFRREIPAAQSMHNAVRRELQHRKRAAKKWGK